MGVINPENRDHLISWIRNFIYSSSNIQLVWIPGLLGNENADAEAKKAAARDRVNDATLEFRDFKRIVSEFELTASKNRSKDRTYLTGNRSEDVFISRIRI
jgi:ribonuclease HI